MKDWQQGYIDIKDLKLQSALIFIILSTMTSLYKKTRLYVQKYNCAKFGVSMYNSVREKCRTNLPVKKKKKKGKKERNKELPEKQYDCVGTQS